MEAPSLARPALPTHTPTPVPEFRREGKARAERPPRGLKPRFASRDRWRRLELAGRLKAFLAAHRDALLAWREGRRDVVFPAGTGLMRVAHGAACAGAG